MATTAKGTPYVESSDLVANYPAVSLALAEHIDDFGGKVLQVVRATDPTQRSTTSTSFVDASISVTITPLKSTSQLLIMWVAYGIHLSTSDFAVFSITDSSNVALSGAEGQHIGSNTTNRIDVPLIVIGWMTAGAVTPLTFKGRFRVASSGGAILENGGTRGQLFAIEVSA